MIGRKGKGFPVLSHFAARRVCFFRITGCNSVFTFISRTPRHKNQKTLQFLENKMANYSREFDIIIFGATGYTGMYVIEELANSAKNSSIKWAVAGRNIEKLKSSLRHVQEYLSGKYYCFYVFFCNSIIS